MKVLVTGSSGFIGSHLTQLHNSFGEFKNIEIIPWQRSQCGSILDQQSVAKAIAIIKPDAILHLAWASTSLPKYETSQSNYQWVEASESLIRTSIDHGVYPFIVGSVLDDEAINTDSSPYQKSKFELRKNLEVEFDQSDYTWIRPHYVLSPELLRPRILKVAHEALTSSQEFAPVNPDSFVDYIHVTDVCSGMLTILQNQMTGIQVLKSGTNRNAFALYHALSKFLKLDAIGSELLRQDPEQYASSVNHSLTLLGWNPSQTDLFFNNL
jgi:nucleoside-diphosphate-sugar epimerase